ncbi:MAG TPA: c-type cytochrome [Methylocystis sp.]
MAAPLGLRCMMLKLGPICMLLLACLTFPLSAEALENSELTDLIAQCAACHGAEGIAKDVEIPNLAGQHDRYLVTQLQNFRSGKRPHKEMRYMSRHLTDDEIAAVAQYYMQLRH